MQFFIDEHGTTKNLISDPIYKGSTNANDVILVAPLAQSNQIYVVFRLPNGTTTTPLLMTLQTQQMVIDNKTYNIWKAAVDGTVTSVAGICKVQFKVTQGSNIVLTTYTSNFTIGEGLLETLPGSNPPSDIYTLILQYLARINPNYQVQNVEYVNESSELENTYWTSLTLMSETHVDASCVFTIANLDGSQDAPLYICSTNHTDNTGFSVGKSAYAHCGKIQINISNCPYDTIIKVYHKLDGADTPHVDGTFKVRAAMGSNVNIICDIGAATNYKRIFIVQDYLATQALDNDNEEITTKGFAKDRYQINSVKFWEFTETDGVYQMEGGEIQISMLNGNIWTFPDFGYQSYVTSMNAIISAAEADLQAYVTEAHAWANGGESGTPSATNNAKHYSEIAYTKAGEAATSETNASNSADAAGSFRNLSEQYARGTKNNGTPVGSGEQGYQSNSKYYADAAAQSASEASDDADSANANALKSEGYAVGTQNGVAVQEGEPYYHDNAKWYNEDLKSQKFAKDLTADLNSTTYVVTLKLYSSTTHIDSGDNSTILATQTFDLPIESAIVNIQYVDTEEHPTSLLFTLQSGATTYVPIGSIISGLATETYVNGEIDKIKNGTYAVGILDGAIVAQGNTYPVSGLVDVINSTLYWKHASHAVDASNLLVGGVAKSGGTIQGEIDAKIPKANIDTSIPATPSNNNVPSTKLLTDKFAFNDGSYDAMSVGDANHANVADNLTPYSEDSGTAQSIPFNMQGTGTGNGETQVAVGAYANIKSKNGNTACVNQLVNTNGDDVTTTSGHKYWTKINGTISIVTSAGADIVVNSNADLVCDLTQWFGSNDLIPSHLLSHPEDFGRYYSGSLAYNTGTLVSANGRYLKSYNRNLFDITTMLGNVTKSGDYYVGAYGGAFDSRVQFNISKLLELNQPLNFRITAKQSGSGGGTPFLRIDYTDGTYDNNALGHTTSDVTLVFHSNTSKVISNVYLSYGVNPNSTSIMIKDVCISIYYEGKSGYDQYYPYKELANIDTGAEDLLSAGSVCDVKLPSGEITHNVVDYTFVNTSGTSNETYNFGTWSSNNVSIRIPIADLPNGSPKSNTSFICSANINCAGTLVIIDGAYAYFRFLGAANTYNDLTAFQAALGTAKIHYVLATPTTTQGTPFVPMQENFDIDEVGSMEWDNTDYNGVPQGCTIFYPVDYKRFVDTAYNHLDGDATNIAKASEITDAALNARGYYTLTQLMSTFGLKDALGGTLRHQLASANNIDFANTVWVDLGELTYTITSSGLFQSYSLQGVAEPQPDSTTKGNIISTIYSTILSADISGPQGATPSPDKVMAISTSGTLYFNNISYTDAAAFKNAMKGSLLAYKKAST